MKHDKGFTHIILNPLHIRNSLFAIIAFLVSMSLIAHVLRFGYGLESASSFVTFFDLNQESNLPTWFSVMLMVACAIHLALIAAMKVATSDHWSLHWSVLAILFLLMSMDEFIQIHERFIKPLRDAFGLSGLMTNAWVLVAFLFLAVMAVFYFRFLRALPSRTARLFVIAGTVYVSGVAGVEMFSGLMKSELGIDSLGFTISTTIEETLEMSGMALFIYALEDYITRQRLQWQLSLNYTDRP